MMKKYVWELIKDNFGEHEETVEKICESISTAKDIEKIGKLFAAMYESGYMKCVEDHRGKLTSMGLKANVVPEEKSGIQIKTSQQIFQEKSG